MVIIHAYIYPVVGEPIQDGYLRFTSTIEKMGPMGSIGLRMEKRSMTPQASGCFRALWIFIPIWGCLAMA